MQTILGANGIISTEIAKELHINYTRNLRLVSRNPKPVNATDKLFSADLLDPGQTEEAVKGSEIVYLTVGLPNNSGLWQTQWPVIMKNVINACISQKAKLVFFDNTYMYGRVEGPITEDLPFNATGKKGKIRAEIALMLLNEIKNSRLTALISRAPEFYGPGNTHGITNSLIFENIKKSQKLNVLLKDSTLRTLIYAPDAGRATALLGNTPDAYMQTWHLPCDNNRLTTKEFIELISQIYGTRQEYMILRKSVIKLLALRNPNMKEIVELLYRYEIDNLFDSSKFSKRFPEFKVTSYEQGIREILKEMH